ncbi:hypothetical protein GF352_02980 [archaeon]|nr:hypothetical protein [archaeon]
MKLKAYFKKHKLFYLFLSVYIAYLFFSINPGHLDSDEASYAMTGVFFERLITDYASSPTLNPVKLYSYAKAYYVHYPKFMFLNGPLYHLINALLFLIMPHSIMLMKLVTLVFSVLTVILTYHVTLLLFKDEPNKQEVSLLSAIFTATSAFFVRSSVTVMLEIPSLFFFMLGMYFYYKKKGLFSGFFFGLSILVKDVSLPYVGVFSLIVLKNLKRQRLKYLLGLLVILVPYAALITASGSYTIFLDYPRKQTYYIDRQGDPQWYELSGWLYYWQIIINNYSLMALPFIFVGLYYSYKRGYKGVLFYILMSFLAVTLMSDKADRRVLNSVVVLSPLLALALSRVYTGLKSNRDKVVGVFTIVLMLVLQTPLFFPKPSVPMSAVAADLISNCPNCTILVASETAMAYSSYLMYESLIRDSGVSLRFLRPTVFESSNSQQVIDEERVNRVVVVGDDEFITDDAEVDSYEGHVLFITNHYNLVGVYESDVVGRIRVYDTGINDSKEPPHCVDSPSIGRSFCTDYDAPLMALH